MPDALPRSDLDIECDRVAREMGLGPEHRRLGAIWATLPHWTNGMRDFVIDIVAGDDGIVAFEVDADRTYAYNAKPLWQEEGTPYEHDFDKAARAYWRSATLLIKLVGKPEPWPGNTEILVRGPVAPRRLRTYLHLEDFMKAEGGS